MFIIDGLKDCQDPDCCMKPSCTEDVFCQMSPDPVDILLRKQPPSPTASFYDRMKFLIEENSVQIGTSRNAFNERYMLELIRESLRQNNSQMMLISALFSIKFACWFWTFWYCRINTIHVYCHKNINFCTSCKTGQKNLPITDSPFYQFLKLIQINVIFSSNVHILYIYIYGSRLIPYSLSITI